MAGLVLACRDAPGAFMWGTYSLGFAHYALALRYSTRQVAQAVATPAQGLSLLGLVCLSFALYYDDFPLVAYFGVHHVLNEAYLRRASTTTSSPFRLQAASCAFHAAAYITILRADTSFAWVEPMPAFAALITATALLARELVRARTAAPTAKRLDLCASDLAAGLLIAASLFVRITFLEIVAYHFILWALLPIEKFRTRGPLALAEYVGLSVAIFSGALLLSPLGPAATRLGAVTFSQHFLFWSYAHITVSFGLSDAQPTWMVKLFRDSVPTTQSGPLSR